MSTRPSRVCGCWSGDRPWAYGSVIPGKPSQPGVLATYAGKRSLILAAVAVTVYSAAAATRTDSAVDHRVRQLGRHSDAAASSQASAAPPATLSSTQT